MGYLNRGDVILVTGATGAIGFEIAAQAAEAGAIVGVHGSRDESVAGAITRLRQRVGNDPQLIAAPSDFRQPESIDAMIEKLTNEAGRLDAIIHCGITGGRGVTGYLAKSDPAGYGDHAALVIGTFQRLAFAALPHLAKQGGTLITFASDAGRFAAPRQSIVGASFAGLIGFVRNFAMEAARDKIRVHCITPSYVEDTPVFDMVMKSTGRTNTARDRAGLGLPSPRDIAPLALFLCGPDATKLTGQILSVNGGLNA